MDVRRTHFCASCHRQLTEIGLFDVPPREVAFFLDFLDRKGLSADLMEGWYWCARCRKYISMPTVEALIQSRLN